MSISGRQRVKNMATDLQDNVGRASCKVFSWGANSYGQLSCGDTIDQSLPREITQSDVKFTYISGGGGHTLAISETGKLFVCGSNNKGQLGLGTTEDMDRLTQVETLKDDVVLKAVGGWDFTVIITLNGDLYVTGSNAFGQLGLPWQPNNITFPTKVELPCPQKDKVVDIAAGLRHIAIVTDKGQVYCCGAGKKGQLGVVFDGKPANKLATLTLVEVPEKIVQITAGSHHTAGLSDSGNVYVWGCNKYGQIAQPLATSCQSNTYCMVSRDYINDKVSQVYSGWTHLIAVTVSGTVYSWGRNIYYQLGRACEESQYHIPRQITSLKNLRSISCGSEHNLAVTEEGVVLSWGWNEHGICGTSDEINVPHPQQVAALKEFKVSHVGCGAGHSFAVCSEIT